MPSKNRPQAQILVVDDEPDLRTLYELTLLREGYQVDAAGSVAEARELLDANAYDLLITDMRLPDGSGIELLAWIRARQRRESSIVITAYGSAENAVEALKAGAFDYLTKPVDLKQFRAVVAASIISAAAPTGHSLPAQKSPPSAPLAAARAAGVPSGHAALERLVGESEAMHQVRDRVQKVASSMAPVMICGESGTGKELVAQALHANSHRHGGPWVAVNCGAIPENLLEAEFFGARKGAYTGASHDRDGYFSAAHGGTLFLDEIGDLPLAMQAKLLRAIQERRVRPIGGLQEEPVDVRIISATHKNLPAEVAAGRFRQDLYYRLNVIDIHLPALRERPNDLPVLCAALLQRIANETGCSPRALSSVALKNLASQALPGNVRELENLLHRALALADPTDPAVPLELPDLTELHASIAEHSSVAKSAQTAASAMSIAELPADLTAHLDAQERAILLRALQLSENDPARAAESLGLTKRQLRNRMTRLNIQPGADTNEAPAHG